MTLSNLLPYNGSLVSINNFLAASEADILQHALISELDWKQIPIKLFGKTHLQPRKIDFLGDNDIKYTYSGKTLTATKWPNFMKPLLQKCNSKAIANFNSCLANLYENGTDYMGMHADNEATVGLNPTVASYSLGATRSFVCKHNTSKERIEIDLEHNSLLIMSETMQHFWKHGLPKRLKVANSRVNLTFREIKKAE